MNSANGVYTALRVPDATVNGSLAPLDFALAMLAFSRGKERAAGDDRKVVGVNMIDSVRCRFPRSAQRTAGQVMMLIVCATTG